MRCHLGTCVRGIATQRPELVARLDIEAANNPYAVIYINGDHNIPASYTPTDGEDAAGWAHKIRTIEPEFLERMFSMEDI